MNALELAVVGSSAVLVGCADGGVPGIVPIELGELSIVVTSSGPGPLRGHFVALDGTMRRAVGPTDSIAVSVFDGRDYLVALYPGEDCLTRDWKHWARSRDAVRFEVSCVGSGTARIVTRTEGRPRPTDPHAVFVESDLVFSDDLHSLDFWDLELPGADSVDLPLTAGGYTLHFRPAPNCWAVSDAYETFEVGFSAVTRMELASACVAEGRLNTFVTAMGGDVPSSFGLRLLGAVHPREAIQSVSTGENVAPWVSVGDWTAELLAPGNCAVQGQNPVPLTVSEGTNTLSFTVVCVRYTGTLTATVTTTGSRRPASYTLGVDRSCAIDSCSGEHALPSNGKVTLNLLPGEHRVGLVYVPANCAVTPGSISVVDVEVGQDTEVVFSAACH